MSDALHIDCDFADRFVYWRGVSGRRYIHTVYEADACPPLPGAVFVAVARDPDGRRRPLAVGCFPRHHAFNLARPAGGGGISRQASEVHVHLLADDDGAREAVLADLSAGLCFDVPAVTAPARAAPRQMPLFAA